MAADPLTSLFEPAAPPPWQGPAHVHYLLSAHDEEPEPPPPPPVSAVPSAQHTHVTCRVCRQTFPAAPEFFYRGTKHPSGFDNICKPCYSRLPSIVARRERRQGKREQDPQKLAERAVAAILDALPPWTLIEPGSPREQLLRKVPARVWWPPAGGAR